MIANLNMCCGSRELSGNYSYLFSQAPHFSHFLSSKAFCWNFCQVECWMIVIEEQHNRIMKWLGMSEFFLSNISYTKNGIEKKISCSSDSNRWRYYHTSIGIVTYDNVLRVHRVDDIRQLIFIRPLWMPLSFIGKPIIRFVVEMCIEQSAHSAILFRIIRFPITARNSRAPHLRCREQSCYNCQYACGAFCPILSDTFIFLLCIHIFLLLSLFFYLYSACRFSSRALCFGSVFSLVTETWTSENNI